MTEVLTRLLARRLTKLFTLLLCILLLAAVTGCAGMVLGGAATGIGVAHDRRTTGTVVEDQSIELKIYDQIYRDKTLLEQSHVNITSYNNNVLLSGEVLTPALKQRVEEIARGTEQVRDVYNELVITPVSTLANRNADTWITAKVKSSLLVIGDIPDFDPSRVKVVTERGTVYLFGLLTRAEAEAVTATVRRVGGVQKVVKLFEYIAT